MSLYLKSINDLLYSLCIHENTLCSFYPEVSVAFPVENATQFFSYAVSEQLTFVSNRVCLNVLHYTRILKDWKFKGLNQL